MNTEPLKHAWVWFRRPLRLLAVLGGLLVVAVLFLYLAFHSGRPDGQGADNSMTEAVRVAQALVL